MRHFTSVYDLPDLAEAIKTARAIKSNPYGLQHLGKDKTMVLIFFDSSLRTRLSTQKAAMNLGMNTMVLNVNQDGWRLESEMGIVMDEINRNIYGKQFR
jgi:N-succinyl-L-ornithine transcarbamylase